MEKVQSSSNYGLGIGMAVLLIAAGFFILLSPFTVSSFQVGGEDRVLKLHYFGHWSLYEGGEMINDGGLANLEYTLGLEKFPACSGAIIMAALILSYISFFFMAFYMGRKHEYFNKHRRISGIASIIVNALGLVGTLLQIPYAIYLGTVYDATRFTVGFYFAIILFSVNIIVGFFPAIKPDKFTKIRTKKRIEPSEIATNN